MRNPKGATHSITVVHDKDPDLVYANDVQVMAEPGGLQLTFLRPRTAADDPRQTSRDEDMSTEVIARVMLPPLAARRLHRRLPRRLDLQQALADEYARETDEEVERDPFLAALAEAEYDDEPYTEEQRAAVQAGREAFARGEFFSLEEVRRDLLGENDLSPVSMP